MSAQPKPAIDLTGDNRYAAFLQHRPLLFGIAYRMLGSTAEAEDVVADAVALGRSGRG